MDRAGDDKTIMINKKILVISTYPIKNPQHGGQKRTHAIVDAYSDEFADVKYCGVFFKGFYKDYSKDDIALGKHSEKKVVDSPFTGDIVVGESIAKDHRVRKKMVKLLESYKPDIIHIEQPFPYLGLKDIIEKHGIQAKIVFGSQNIEAPMKKEILENAGFPNEKIKQVVEQIHNLEIDLSRRADLTVACTVFDLETHKKMGSQKLVLAPNGISLGSFSNEDRTHWEEIFAKEGINRLILFVGSAHPPNWIGFFDMVGKGLGFIPDDTRIVIAGSICDYFTEHIKDKNLDLEDATFWLRAYPAGRLSEERLAALLDIADTIILPITEGGGSNLKTAEAILADKKVVATEHALRSFEWFEHFPDTWVGNTKKEFQKHIITAINTKKQVRKPSQKKKVQDVEWKSTLESLMKEAKKL